MRHVLHSATCHAPKDIGEIIKQEYLTVQELEADMGAASSGLQTALLLHLLCILTLIMAPGPLSKQNPFPAY